MIRRKKDKDKKYISLKELDLAASGCTNPCLRVAGEKSVEKLAKSLFNIKMFKRVEETSKGVEFCSLRRHLGTSVYMLWIYNINYEIFYLTVNFTL